MHRDSIEPGIASDISTISPKGGSIGGRSTERLIGEARNDISDIWSFVHDLLSRLKKLEGSSNENISSITSDNLTPDKVDYDHRAVCIVPFESDEDVSTGDGTIAFTVPNWMDNYLLHDVVASVHTKGITGTTDIQVRKRSGGSDADVLSTKVTVGDEFYARDEGINMANASVSTGDQLYIDVDAVHSGTAPNGLSVSLVFVRQ